MKYLTTKYDRSDLSRRLQAQNTLGLLEFTTLWDYIAALETALHQFVAMGGVPSDWLVLQQLGKLPPTILTQLNVPTIKTTTDLLAALRLLATKDLSISTPPTTAPST